MRRVVSPVRPLIALSASLLALAGLGSPAAFAQAPGTGVAALAPAPGKKACTITSDRLLEASGLIATASGYVVVNDGTDIGDRKRVFFLDNKCKIVKEARFKSNALDPEDLALSPDRKNVWVADIGDNDAKRPRIALWMLPADGSKQATIYRLAYPDGAHDAEALLIAKDGTPIIVTKSTSGKAGIYVPTAKLKANTEDGVPLRKAGEVTLPKSTTEYQAGLGALGRLLVTGAATAPDGSKVVLRTYADAFEYDVPDGDVVKALTTLIDVVVVFLFTKPFIALLAKLKFFAKGHPLSGLDAERMSDAGSARPTTPQEA